MACKASLLSTSIISRDHQFSRLICCLLSCIKRFHMTSQWCPIPKHWKGGQIFVPVKAVPREFSHVKNFFCSKDFCIAAGHVTEIHLYVVKINLVPRSLVDESALEIWIRDCVGMPK